LAVRLYEPNNVLILGPTGIGKSWIACAFGNGDKDLSPRISPLPPSTLAWLASVLPLVFP
jgi:hypothetical protein